MPTLKSSTRRINRASHVSLRAADTPQEQDQKKLVARPLEKVNFLRSLRIGRDELVMLGDWLREYESTNSAVRGEFERLSAVAATMAKGGARSGNIQLAPALASVPAEILAGFGRLIASQRRRLADRTRSRLERVHKEHESGIEPSAVGDGPSAFHPRPTFAAARNAGLARPVHLEATGDGQGARTTTAGPEPATRAAIDVDQLALPHDLDRSADLADSAVDGFLDQFHIEPIGRLHLERLEMTPVGMERGELVYSIPLAPKETVNIGHKEWSVRSDEFESIVKDSFEGFSEQGVSEKKDLSHSTDSENQHTSAYSLSGSYSGFGASATASYNDSSADQQAEKESREQSCSLTRKASARVRKEHQQSFQVTSVVGSEDQSVRVISNPSETKECRVDYYQLMRKWQVDLYRYGLRMTYDLVVPNPGAELIETLDQVRELDALIDEPFSFPLMPSDITPENWTTYAAHWSARVDPPGADPLQQQVSHVLPTRSGDEADEPMMVSIDFTVDADYAISSASLFAHIAGTGRTWPDRPANHFSLVGMGSHRDPPLADHITSDLSELTGKSGNLAVIYSARSIKTGAVLIDLVLAWTAAAKKTWQQRAWTAMREAAEESYHTERQARIDQRNRLMEDINGRDALSLRQLEREAVMKSVLQWLFGPTFSFTPANIPATALPPVPGPTEGDWERVIQHGELIKFLHQAIEWENMLYFTYPYFWDAQNSRFKRFLQHPDSRHRDFLRAGSARVVLTIRPGYEVDFARFVEVGGLGDGHPYMTIAEEIQEYANTNYPGIPAANPEVDNAQDVEGREKGTLIGRWYEYTPTSALDISIDTPFLDLA
jgi:hypothetical protein